MDRFDEMYDPAVHRAVPPKRRKNPLDDFEDIELDDDEDEEDL